MRSKTTNVGQGLISVGRLLRLDYDPNRRKNMSFVIAFALGLIFSGTLNAQSDTDRSHQAVRDFNATSNQVALNEGFVSRARQIPGFRVITNTPPVPATSFLDGSNKLTNLQNFKGKVSLINFWATWCTPCLREMPDLNSVARDLSKNGVEVVAIASGNQMGKNPAAFLEKHKLTSLDLYKDPHGSLMKLFDLQTLPSTLIADRNGHILGGVVGATDWNSEAARTALIYLAKQK